MARWGAPNAVVLHATGRPANICAMVGSAVLERLIYLDSGGNPQDLSAWTLTTKAEIYRGEWSDDDELVSILPTALAGDTAGVAATAADQAQAPGGFDLFVPATLPPVAHRNVRIGAVLLPTLTVWVKLTAPASAKVVDQARVAVGWRRGAGSVNG